MGVGRPSMGARAPTNGPSPSGENAFVDHQMDEDTPVTTPQQGEEPTMPPRKSPVEEPPLADEEQVPMDEDAPDQPEPPVESEVEDTVRNLFP